MSLKKSNSCSPANSTDDLKEEINLIKDEIDKIPEHVSVAEVQALRKVIKSYIRGLSEDFD